MLVNNKGGGIFSFLPVKGQVQEEQFAALWATPQNVDLEGEGGSQGEGRNVDLEGEGGSQGEGRNVDLEGEGGSRGRGGTSTWRVREGV